MGRFNLAERMYRRALKLLSKKPTNYKESLATLFHNLGGLQHARGRYGLALRLARRGLALRRSIRPCDKSALIGDEAALAVILTDLGHTGEAADIYRRVLRHYRRGVKPRMGSQHESNLYELGSTMANLGASYAKTARLAAANRNLRQAVSLLERALGKNHPRLVAALNNLAVVCARRGNFQEAEASCRRALRLVEMQPGRTYPAASVLRQNYRKLHVQVHAGPVRVDALRREAGN
jgi:tetratricopeptide (TPR) repeat protein